jgi:hypothetical protein
VQGIEWDERTRRRALPEGGIGRLEESDERVEGEYLPSIIGLESTTTTEKFFPEALACKSDFSTTDDLQSFRISSMGSAE